MIKAYYIGPLGGGDYHLYSPEQDRCYLAGLRGKLKKGVRRNTSLKPGSWVVIDQMRGTNRWKIMERLNQPRETVDIDLHQCKFEH